MLDRFSTIRKPNLDWAGNVSWPVRLFRSADCLTGMKRNSYFLSVVAAMLAACGVPDAADTTDRDRAAPSGVFVPGQPFLRFATTDSLSREVTFYLSEEPADGPRLPLLAYVQGSSTSSHFIERDGRIRGKHGQNSIRDVVGGRARLLLVEKPGVEFLDDPERPDGAGASAEFRREHTLDRWAAAVNAAIEAAGSLPAVDTSRILVAGHSEGGIVAARVAALHPEVTHVALSAGGGPTKLYDLVELAREGVFFRRISEEDAAARVAYVMESWRRIQQHPEAADSVFFGHSYQRWHSFLTTSAIEELRATDSRIYLAQGMSDDAVRPETLHIACAELRAVRSSEDVICDAVAGADHSFTTDDGGVDGWTAVWHRVLEWFLAGE